MASASAASAEKLRSRAKGGGRRKEERFFWGAFWFFTFCLSSLAKANKNWNFWKARKEYFYGIYFFFLEKKKFGNALLSGSKISKFLLFSPQFLFVLLGSRTQWPVSQPSLAQPTSLSFSSFSSLCVWVHGFIASVRPPFLNSYCSRSPIVGSKVVGQQL